MGEGPLALLNVDFLNLAVATANKEVILAKRCRVDTVGADWHGGSVDCVVDGEDTNFT